MTLRHRTEEEELAEPTPERRAIDALTNAVAEKVDAAHQALDRFLKEGNTNGAR